MTMEFKATVQHRNGKIIALVDEYIQGVYKRSIEFVDAPEFKDLFSAYDYARREVNELNRRLNHEKQ